VEGSGDEAEDKEVTSPPRSPIQRPVKSSSEAAASGSDDEEHSAHYSSSGYYESPPDEAEGYGSAEGRVLSGERREWTEEEKRRRKKGFKLDFSPMIDQERTESTSPAGKEMSHPLLKNIMMENAVFWDVAPGGFIIKRRFGGTCRLHIQGISNNAREEKAVGYRLTLFLDSVIPSILKMEAPSSSETTLRHITENGILHSHSCNSPKPYKIMMIHHLIQMLRSSFTT
jgi:hypothetical protein